MSLAQLSYYQTGGTCEHLWVPGSLEELQETLQKAPHTPLFLLGGGTNSLVMDEHWPGAVISFHRLNHMYRLGDTLVCGAGVPNQALCERAWEEGLGGLEWMYGLPGQVGGTVRMNARCYGGEISQVVTQVDGCTLRGEPYTVRTACDPVFYGYKHTVFMEHGGVIGQAVFQLRSWPENDLENSRLQGKARMQACYKDREQKGQYLYPSCGCVFKNDYRLEVCVSSGLLLEQSGVKGLTQGLAAVSPYHCNFVYNQGGATSRDIVELTFQMREAVYREFGVWLEYEMEILGHLPPDLRQAFYEHRPPHYKHQRLEALQKDFKKHLSS